MTELTPSDAFGYAEGYVFTADLLSSADGGDRLLPSPREKVPIVSRARSFKPSLNARMGIFSKSAKSAAPPRRVEPCIVHGRPR